MRSFILEETNWKAQKHQRPEVAYFALRVLLKHTITTCLMEPTIILLPGLQDHVPGSLVIRGQKWWFFPRFLMG